MKRLRQKLKNSRGLTLVEMMAASAILILLALMLHTGLIMAQDSYNKMTSESESQLLLSTLTDLLAHELRYARDVDTSVNYGRHTTLSLNAETKQLEASGRQMLSSGAYGNGAYQIETCSITYTEDTGLFHVQLKVAGPSSIANEAEFFVRCLNAEGGEGGTT